MSLAEDYPNDLLEFETRFATTEEACRAYIAHVQIMQQAVVTAPVSWEDIAVGHRSLDHYIQYLPESTGYPL